MKSISLAIVYLLTVTLSFAQGTQEVLDKYFNAIGGKDECRKIKTLKYISQSQLMGNMITNERNNKQEFLSVSQIESQKGTSTSNDTVYYEYPYKEFSFFSIVNVAKKRNIYVKKKINKNSITSIYNNRINVTENDSTLVNHQIRYINEHFPFQLFLKYEHEMENEGVKEFNGIKYNVLSRKVTFTNKETATVWYYFNIEDGLLSMSKQINDDREPTRFYSDYVRFQNLQFATHEKQYLFREQQFDTTYSLFEYNIQIPAFVFSIK